MSREELVGTRRSRVGRHVVRGFQPGKLLALRGADDPKKPPRIKIRDLARVTGIGMTTIRNWETGVSVPQVDKLLKVATKLGVKPPMDELIVVPRDERFPADWRALYGLLQPDLGRIVGIETSVISLIETGTRIPTPEQAAAIAAVFKISVHEFMESFERVHTIPLDVDD